jgi:hypothetical protein
MAGVPSRHNSRPRGGANAFANEAARMLRARSATAHESSHRGGKDDAARTTANVGARDHPARRGARGREAPTTTRFLMNQMLLKTGDGWKVMAILPIVAATP